jgi:hypothetical protein
MEQAASRPHTHRNFVREFAVIIFIAILLQRGRLKVETQIPFKAANNPRPRALTPVAEGR